MTGGIGSGKSAALAAFARCGAATLSADAAAHAIYSDPAVRATVADRFGPEVLDAAGVVDRAALGRRAFAAEGGMAFLEALLHPRIQARRAEWVEGERARCPPPPLLVCEVPLLYEVGAEGAFDVVLVVTASEAVRRERVAARGQDFAGRAARQLPEAEKAARAGGAYVNDGPLAGLEAWVADRFGALSGRPCA